MLICVTPRTGAPLPVGRSASAPEAAYRPPDCRYPPTLPPADRGDPAREGGGATRWRRDVPPTSDGGDDPLARRTGIHVPCV